MPAADDPGDAAPPADRAGADDRAGANDRAGTADRARAGAPTAAIQRVYGDFGFAAVPSAAADHAASAGEAPRQPAQPTGQRTWPSWPARLWHGRVRAAGELSALAVLLQVFIPFALGHYLSWLLRTVNAMLAPQMLQAAQLTPAQLGTLTSTYFLAFALAQLPVGLALDRHGPRRVQAVMLLIAAAGTYAFAQSQSFTQMAIARSMMGLGLAACFMAAMKAISTWISPKKAPSVQGYLIAAGGLGAATATLPVRLALHYTDWRGIFTGLAICCAAHAAVITLLAPTAPPAPLKPASRQALKEIFTHKAFRDTAALVLIPHTVYFGIQGLWISRWLADTAYLDQQSIAWLLYLGMVGVIFGAIAVGMLTEWAAKQGRQPIDLAALGIAAFVILQCAMIAAWRPAMPMLAVAFMLVGTITGIEYTIVAQSVPPALMGRTSTCLNLLIFTGAFAVQAGFGAIVACWPAGPAGRAPAQAYQCAFAVLVLLQLPGLLHYLHARYRAHREASRSIR
jgi:MFS family permease